MLALVEWILCNKVKFSVIDVCKPEICVYTARNILHAPAPTDIDMSLSRYKHPDPASKAF